MGTDNPEMTQDRDDGRRGIDAIENGNNQYHIACREKGSREKDFDAQSNLEHY